MANRKLGEEYIGVSHTMRLPICLLAVRVALVSTLAVGVFAGAFYIHITVITHQTHGALVYIVLVYNAWVCSIIRTNYLVSI